MLTYTESNGVLSILLIFHVEKPSYVSNGAFDIDAAVMFIMFHVFMMSLY